MNNSIINEDIKSVLESDFINFKALNTTNFLVTGASGMLCSFVIKTLLKITSGKVFAIFRNRERFDALFSEFSTNPNLVAIESDISTFNCNIIKDEIDYIIHGASVGSPTSYIKDPLDVFHANCIGMLKLIELAKVKRVKNFAFISSASVYGDVGGINNVSEDYIGSLNQLDIRSCYSESKRMAENILASWCKVNNRDFSIIRPFHTYGPGMRMDDGRIFADLVDAVVNQKDIIVNSDGSAVRAFCYIADFASALLAIISSQSSNQAWNVGSSQDAINIIDLAHIVSNIIPDLKVNVIATAKGETKSSGISRVVPDVTKLSRLGWKRKFDLKSGFKRTITHYLLNKQH